MGEIISANAGIDAIIGDAKTALDRAKLRGGEAQSLAEIHLGPTLTVLASTEGQMAPLSSQIDGLDQEIEVLNADSDDLVKGESDMLWNKLGRPGTDPYMEVIFPGGTDVYTEGKAEDQPGKMMLLAEFLQKGAHPKLDPALALASAQRITAQAGVFQAKVDEARPLKSKLSLLESVRKGLAKVARLRLVSLKRAYLAAGMSEADIHQIIPDRPSGRAKKKGEGGPEGG